jgi:hypothetical protein
MKQVESIDWDNLFHCVGMPKNIHDFSNKLSAVSKTLAKKWLKEIINNGSNNGAFGEAWHDALLPLEFKSSDLEGWNCQQTLIFLDEFLEYCDDNNTSIDETVSNLYCTVLYCTVLYCSDCS